MRADVVAEEQAPIPSAAEDGDTHKHLDAAPMPATLRTILSGLLAAGAWAGARAIALSSDKVPEAVRKLFDLSTTKGAVVAVAIPAAAFLAAMKALWMADGWRGVDQSKPRMLPGKLRCDMHVAHIVCVLYILLSLCISLPLSYMNTLLACTLAYRCPWWIACSISLVWAAAWCLHHWWRSGRPGTPRGPPAC